MKVRQILGKPEETLPEQPSPLLCLPKCRIGLEYEWEQTTALDAALGGERGEIAAKIALKARTYFGIHNDGSLRENGKEFVFSGPFFGSKIIDAVDVMDELARVLDFKGSYRTSLHVHMDMQDVNFPEDIERLGAVYCLVEPFLYKFVGSARDQCNYSLPWYVHSQPFETYFAVLRENPITERTDFIGDRGGIAYSLRAHKVNKYSGLNFFSLGDFGTVEFRHAPVTMQKDKIIQWINIIMRLKKWVMEKPKKPTELITYANKMGPYYFLGEVFGEQYKDLVKMSKDPVADLQLGLSTLYQFIASA